MPEGESQLIERIRRRHPPPAYAVLSGVRNQTGYGKRVRTADALALSLWPSNGIAMHGFEVKCSLSDLKKELDDPTKSAEFSLFCDYWWIVVADAKLIDGLELPPRWGVLAPHSNSLKVVVAAPKLTPQPPTRELLCGIIRNFSDSIESRLRDMVPAADVEKVVRDRVEGQVVGIRRDAERSYKELQDTVKNFEQSSGVSIRDKWHSERIGQAVKLVMQHGGTRISDSAKREIQWAKEFVASLERFVRDGDGILSDGKVN